ncbi:MAG: 50S ribosomal protein L22 [Patescibacteria group bacterium]|nr:50S ribosomal protein L22 [Patescibacteria group bacterium]
MEIKAVQKTTRQTPLKVRLVANAVRKLSIPKAITQLATMERRASLLVLKVLRQAIANALHNHHLSLDQLTIKSILVNEGPRYKRFNAVSRGRGHAILKRTCHVTVILISQDASLIGKESPTGKKRKM